MAEFENSAKAFAATAGKIARLQDAKFEADILEQSVASLVKTGSQEDWGEVREFYTFMLEVPIQTYVAIDDQRANLEKLIGRRIQQLVRTQSGKVITEVVISPVLAEESRPAESKSEGGQTNEETPSFWQAGFFRLFISHTSGNRDSAHRLKQALVEYNVAAFVAHDDIEPTKEWEAEIERALRTMDALSAIISPDFFQSRWCDQEVGFAFGRSKLVVPICKDAIPHGFLGKYQGFKAQGLVPSAVAEKLADVLIGHPLTSQRMADALVERMVRSGGWEMSKRTMAFLEKVTRLNESQVAKLMQAAEDNSEVRDAFSVPGRIQSLIARVGKTKSVT